MVKISQFRVLRLRTVLYYTVFCGCVYYLVSSIRVSVDSWIGYSAGTVYNSEVYRMVQGRLDVSRMLRWWDNRSAEYSVADKGDSGNNVARTSSSENIIPSGNKSENLVPSAVKSKDIVSVANNSNKTMPKAGVTEDAREINKSKDSMQLPWCPDNPGVKDPVFRLKLNETTEERLEVELGNNMQNGGHFRPSTCRSREHLAIIIPNRDRDRNLHILLRNLLPFLWLQRIEFTVFLVEQSAEFPFNKGVLLNAAFKESQKLGKFTCFVMQDVDLLPMDNRNLYRCGDHPRHLCLTSGQTKWKNKVMYPMTFGGAIALRQAHMEQANGFSVSYYGWGLEDDDLALRLNHQKLQIHRYPVPIGKYYKLDHNRTEPNPQWKKLKRTILKRERSEGLNTLNYTLLRLEARPLYTYLLIRVPPPPTSIYNTTYPPKG